MKNMLRLLVLGIGVFGTSLASDFRDFPSLEEVIEHVYTNYRIDPVEANQVHFARKSTGWHLQLRPWNDIHKLLDDDQVWSSQTGDWLPLRATYPRRTLDQATRVDYHYQRYLSQTIWNKAEYDRCAWYGYPEWAEDVVSDFGDSTDLAPILLESLGRAYGFLADQILFSSKGIMSKTWQPLSGAVLTDPARLEAYLDAANQSIECWKKMVSDFPTYEMLTGLPEVKLSNEKLTFWLHLTLSGQSSEARRFRESISYPPNHRVIATHILNSLPTNCVFLANGDNDFFPLIQTQSEGIREDVLIVSNALLNASWYRSVILDSMGIRLSSDEADALEKGYMYLPAGDRDVEVRLFGGDQKFRFKPGITGTRKYLLASEVSLIRLLGLSGPASRPVAFSLGSSYETLKNLEPYLRISGPAYVIEDDLTGSVSDNPMVMLLGQVPSSSWKELSTWTEEELTLLANSLNATEADRRVAEAPLRWITSAIYKRSLMIGADTTGTDEAQQKRDDFVLMYDHLDKAFQEADIRSAHHLASLAVSGHQAGMPWLGETWEKKLYKVLEEFDWESAYIQEESPRMARFSLQLLGLYYEESGNDLQATAINQIMTRYWERLQSSN